MRRKSEKCACGAKCGRSRISRKTLADARRFPTDNKSYALFGLRPKHPRRAAGRVPGPQGPHPSRLSPPLRFVDTKGMRACGPSARLLRTARPAAPGPLPLRSSAPARRARRRFAGPVRGLAAALRLPGPPPGACPPAPALGRCLRASPSAGARWPRSPCLPIRSGCGLPLVGLAPLRVGGGLRVARRVPLAPSASRLRGRLAPGPGPLAALRAAFSGLGPGPLGCAPAPARACLVPRRPPLLGLRPGAAAAFRPWGSPCFPPAPAAPPWLAGSARLVGGLLRRLWPSEAARLFPGLAAPGPCPARPFGPVHNPKIVNWGLTIVRERGILVPRGWYTVLSGPRAVLPVRVSAKAPLFGAVPFFAPSRRRCS